MRLLLILCITSFSMGLSTCKKEPVKEQLTPIYSPPKSVLETIWTTPLEGYSINPMLNSNGDVLMSRMFNNTGKGEIIQLLDGNTGKLKWEWNDYITPSEGFTDNLHAQINDVLILSSGKENYALNMITGETIWKNRMDSLGAESQIFKDEDGYIYKGFMSYSQPATVYVFRTFYNTGKWELVCSYTDRSIEFGRFDISAIGVTKNAKGEKIVAISIYTLYPDGKNGKALIVGYNLTTQKFDWERDYGNFLSEFSVFMFSNYKGIVYSFANYGSTCYLLAINADDGSIRWQRLLPDFGVGLYFYKDNVIVTCNGESAVTSLNQQTGEMVWQQTFAEFSPAQKSFFAFTFGDSKVFKKYFLSTQCHNLLVLDADDGRVQFYERTALPEGCLQHGLVVDEQKRVFYVEDRLRALCYKLPAIVR